ncbi:hypothetical protein N7488_003826 [Penicillium malachiteum]|nr:hypothetical protein N7488_003826 [Penicillium malachiteum]
MSVITSTPYTPPTWLARAHGPVLPQWVWQYRENQNTLEKMSRAFEHIKKDDDPYKFLLDLRKKGKLDFTPFSFTEGPVDQYITPWFEANDDVEFHPKRDVRPPESDSWTSFDSHGSYEEDPYVTSWFKAYPDVNRRPKFDVLQPKNNFFEAHKYNMTHWVTMNQPERDERLGDALASELFSHIISSTTKGPEPEEYQSITLKSKPIKKALEKLPIKLLSLIQKDKDYPRRCQPIGTTEVAGCYKACHRIAFIQQTELAEARGPSLAELTYLVAIMQDASIMQNKVYKKLTSKKSLPKRSSYFHHTSPVLMISVYPGGYVRIISCYMDLKLQVQFTALKKVTKPNFDEVLMEILRWAKPKCKGTTVQLPHLLPIEESEEEADDESDTTNVSSIFGKAAKDQEGDKSDSDWESLCEYDNRSEHG